VRRSRMSGRRDELGGARLCARAMGKNISRPKQVTDWFARLEKLEQALAADSGSGLLVQPAWIEKNVPDICATNSLVRKISACLCVRFSAYSRQTEAGVARALIARLKAAEFLPSSYRVPGFSRWVLTSTTGQDCEHMPSH